MVSELLYMVRCVLQLAYIHTSGQAPTSLPTYSFGVSFTTRLEEGLLLLDLLLIGSVGDVRIYRHDTPTVTEGERWVTEWQCE